jgi:acyl-CoA thioesterase-1
MANTSQIGHAEKIVGLLLAVAAILSAGPAAARTPTVVMLGDSVTAGYGLAAADALPIQLQVALARLGHPAVVVSAGVSGDTTADALARADFSVPAATDLCVVELGGNDLLQGVDPSLIRRNLEAIVRRLKVHGVRAVIVGVSAPPQVGADYARDFDAAFTAAAKDTQTPLFADWLAVVPRALRQADGLHPNPTGVQALAAALAPFVIKSLKSATVGHRQGLAAPVRGNGASV